MNCTEKGKATANLIAYSCSIPVSIGYRNYYRVNGTICSVMLPTFLRCFSCQVRTFVQLSTSKRHK